MMKNLWLLLAFIPTLAWAQVQPTIDNTPATLSNKTITDSSNNVGPAAGGGQNATFYKALLSAGALFNGSHDDGPAWNTVLGTCTVVAPCVFDIPAGLVSKINTGITPVSGEVAINSPGVTLDATGMTAGCVTEETGCFAMALLGSNNTTSTSLPLNNVRIILPTGNTNNVDGLYIGTATGTVTGQTIENLQVIHGRDGVYFGNNSYTDVLVNPNIQQQWRYGINYTSTTTAGENNSIHGGRVFDVNNSGAGIGIYMPNSGSEKELQLFGVSLDYNDLQCEVDAGILTFVGSHIEDNHFANPLCNIVSNSGNPPTGIYIFGGDVSPTETAPGSSRPSLFTYSGNNNGFFVAHTRWNMFGSPSKLLSISSGSPQTVDITGSTLTSDGTAYVNWPAVSVTLASGAQNNLAPGNGFPAGIDRIDLNSTAGAASITGLVAGTDGQEVTIRNLAGGNNVTLNNLNSGSSSANQFSDATDVVLTPGSSVKLEYYLGRGNSIVKWVIINRQLVAADLPAGVPSGSANPSATIGLTAVNGTASTFQTSDSAPALSQAIVPTWSGVHTFSAIPVFSVGVTVDAPSGNLAFSPATSTYTFGNTTDNPVYSFLGSGGFGYTAGTSTFSRLLTSQSGGGDLRWNASSAGSNLKLWAAQTNLSGNWILTTLTDAGAATKNALAVTRTTTAVATMVYGNSSDNPTHTFNGAVLMPTLASSSAATTGTVCWTTSTGNLNVDTTTTCLLSDGRLKMNVSPLDVGIDEVMKLNPVSYELKPEVNPSHLGRQVGLIAQDVMAVDPRLAATYQSGPNEGTPSGVRYEQMVALLVKAMQEQEHKIDRQQLEIYALALALLLSFGFTIYRTRR